MQQFPEVMYYLPRVGSLLVLKEADSPSPVFLSAVQTSAFVAATWASATALGNEELM